MNTPDPHLTRLRLAGKLQQLVVEIQSIGDAADIESVMHKRQLMQRAQDIVAILERMQVEGGNLEESAQLETSIPELYGELVTLCKAGLMWAKKHGYPEVEDYPQYQRAREIGELLHRHAGLPAMQKAVHIVYEQVESEDGGQAALLEYGWSGIGNWQA